MNQTAPLAARLETLRASLRNAGSLLVAFSGGVDSTFLLKIAHDELGEKAMGVTVTSPLFPSWEMEEARSLANAFHWNHRLLDIPALEAPGVAENSPERCYHCKKSIFEKLTGLAREENLAFVADGATVSDDTDYRPGHRATRQLGVLSPLRDAGLTKLDVRALSRAEHLPTWDKPAYACLASRVPYGLRLSEDLLEKIDRAESVLHDLGYRDCRVRAHGEIARIEVPPADIPALADKHRGTIAVRLRELGFRYVSLDLEGYRTGSLNEVLPESTP